MLVMCCKKDWFLFIFLSILSKFTPNLIYVYVNLQIKSKCLTGLKTDIYWARTHILGPCYYFRSTHNSFFTLPLILPVYLLVFGIFQKALKLQRKFRRRGEMILRKGRYISCFSLSDSLVWNKWVLHAWQIIEISNLLR